MTTPDPLEDWYRAAIAETMRLCPQYDKYRPGKPKPPKVPARQVCPICHVEFTRSYLPEHIERIHSQGLGNGDNPVDEVAS